MTLHLIQKGLICFVYETGSCPIITKNYMNISNIMRALGNMGFFLENSIKLYQCEVEIRGFDIKQKAKGDFGSLICFFPLFFHSSKVKRNSVSLQALRSLWLVVD